MPQHPGKRMGRGKLRGGNATQGTGQFGSGAKRPKEQQKRSGATAGAGAFKGTKGTKR